MILLASNNASGKLLSSINNTATSVTLQTGQGALFPSPVSTVSYSYLAHVNPVTNLVDEIVQVTAVSGDTFTIVRGQEGTTAVAWLAGDIVGDYFTAGSFNALAQKQQVQSNLFNYADDTGAVNAYVVTLSPVPVIVDGFLISFSTANANTSATPTVTVNGTNFNITGPSGIALVVGQIPANTPVQLIYNSTGPRFELQGSFIQLIPTGMILPFSGLTVPTGFLALPVAATTKSRTTYANLNAVMAADSYPWGNGDGSTTFNIPFVAAGGTLLQPGTTANGSSGSIGSTGAGQVISHTHTSNAGIANNSTTTSGGGAGATYNIGTATINATGGANNLACGSNVNWCIKY